MWFSLLFSLSLLAPSLAPEDGASALSPAATKAIAAALDGLTKDPLFEKLELGVSARCTNETRTHSRDGDKLLNPASGAKLLSTAAALSQLGPEYRFATTLDGVLGADGTLTAATLVAGGDPALESSDFARLVDLAKSAGVKRIKGDLTIDLGHFAGSTTAPAFDQKNTDAAYRPEITALAIGSAAVQVTVRAGKKVGDPVTVNISPSTNAVKIENTAKTLAGKRLDKLVIESRAHAGGTRILVAGGLGVQAQPQGVRKRLHGASRVAGELFVQQLTKSGIGFEGAVRFATPNSATNASSRTIARIESRPLAELVALINKTSNNFMAEAVFLQLGGPTGPATRGATWERAATTATSSLRGLGLQATSFTVVNGSGLYDATMITPDGMAALLAALDGTTERDVAFRDSLAVAGETGTLRHRLKALGPKLRGKTGTLDRALSLSGYIDRAECRLAFSVIVNGAIGKNAGKVSQRIDAFVQAIAK